MLKAQLSCGEFLPDEYRRCGGRFHKSKRGIQPEPFWPRIPENEREPSSTMITELQTVLSTGVPSPRAFFSRDGVENRLFAEGKTGFPITRDHGSSAHAGFARDGVWVT